MKKICHITTVHTRYDVRIFHKECKSLAKKYNVYLIVADGLKDETVENVKITDIGLRQASRLKRAKIDSKKALKKALELDCDLYHFHDPELIPIGVKLKKLGKQVIFDIHENTDLQILEKEWIPFVFRRILSKTYSLYEKYHINKFDMLIIPQNAMLEKFSKINKTAVIGNFPNRKINNNTDLKDSYNKFKLLYAGSINEARGLFNMLNLIKELKSINKEYSLTIAGSIEDSMLEKVKQYPEWEFVNYLGFISKEKIEAEYKKHTIGLIMFNNVGQYFMAYSLKLFEYMQNGMTIIMPNFGDWIAFNNTYKAGYNIDVHDSKATAKLIDSFTDDIFVNFKIINKTTVNTDFSWESQEKKLFKIYTDILDNLQN